MALVLVVGAGVTGLVTAIRCALTGHRVTVLDRGPVPNPASTSADEHRVLRLLRPGDLDATRRMIEARDRWLGLESLLRTKFFRRVGIVTACAPDEVEPVLDIAREARAAAAVVAPETLAPVAFPAGTTGVLDRAAGVLLAEKFLRTAAEWLAAHPAVTLRPGCAVSDVDDHRVVLADGTPLGADVVVVAAGPWSAELAGDPVRLHRQTMVYLRAPQRLAAWWASAPGVGRIGAHRTAWLVPPGDGTLLKISSDAVCREVDRITDPDPAPWADRLLAESILADLGDYDVVGVRDGHYATDPATGGPVLTRVCPSVWCRSACGGTGFSSAPLVADEIVDAVMEVSA